MEGVKQFLQVMAGSGDGYGYGSGSGSGYGSGSGDGYGLKSFNGDDVHYIDGVPTVIKSVKGFVARGLIINHDLTTTPTYVVRVGNSFAHGETIKEAQSDAEAKHLQDSPVEDRVSAFLDAFDGVETIPASELFDWHFKLTGSCKQGRNAFVKDNGIDLEKDSFTI